MSVDYPIKAISKLPHAIFLDFDGVLTDNFVYTSSDGIEFVKCNKFDSMGLSSIKEFIETIEVISSESNSSVKHRCKKLKLRLHLGVPNKLIFANKLFESYGLDSSDIMYIGNDINDLSLLNSVGIPVVVNNCHDSLCSLGFYRTTFDGGNGALREITDHLHHLYTKQ